MDSERSVKSDNILAWDGRARPFYEVYYLKTDDPGGRWSLWLRYTMCTAAPGFPDGVAALWAVFTDSSGQKVALKQEFDLRAYDIVHTDHFIKIDQSYLSLAEAVGGIEGVVRAGDSRDGGGCGGTGRGGGAGGVGGAATTIKWDLAFEDPVVSLRPYPAVFYRWSFPRTKFLSPRLVGFVSGTVFVGDRKLKLNRFRVHQSHLYGTAYANDWAWASVSEFREDSEAWFTGLSARVQIGQRLSPSFKLFCIGMEGMRLCANSPLKMLLGNESRHDSVEWRFACKKSGFRFDGHIWRDPQFTAGVTYDGPNGEKRFCYNTGMATCEIQVQRRRRGFWRHYKMLTCEGKCAFETVSPVASEVVPVVL